MEKEALLIHAQNNAHNFSGLIIGRNKIITGPSGNRRELVRELLKAINPRTV